MIVSLENERLSLVPFGFSGSHSSNILDNRLPVFSYFLREIKPSSIPESCQPDERTSTF